MSLLEQVMQAPADVKDQVLMALLAEMPARKPVSLAKLLPMPKLSDEEIERIRNATRHNTKFVTIDEFIARIPDDM